MMLWRCKVSKAIRHAENAMANRGAVTEVCHNVKNITYSSLRY